MKTTATATILSAACSAALIGANPMPATSQLQGFQKNIARQHYAANIFVFDAATQRYVATEAAATWLDDDVTTMWSPLAGKQHYLVQFAEPQMINNFSLSGRNMVGTVSLYTADSAAAPGDKAWTPVAQSVDYNALNNKRLAKPVNKFAKCLLIETNIAEPKAIYSIQVYGEASSASQNIAQRVQPVDIATLGEFVNNQTAFNIAGLYAQARVTFANSGTNRVAWQRAIDDNPETFTSVAPSSTEAGAIVKFAGAHPVSRLSIQSNAGAKGKLDVYLLSEAPDAGQTVNIEGVTPSVSFRFDGVNDRTSADIAETTSVAMALHWTPENGTDAIALHEINVFGDLSLANYEVIGTPVAIAQSPEQVAAEEKAGTEASDGKTLAPVASGKETVDFKGGKTALPPVALGPGSGYRPGMPGFPPNVILRPPNDPPVVSP